MKLLLLIILICLFLTETNGRRHHKKMQFSNFLEKKESPKKSFEMTPGVINNENHPYFLLGIAVCWVFLKIFF